MIKNQIPEFKYGERGFQVLADVGYAASDRFHRFVLKFIGINVQRTGEVGHLSREKQGSMVQYPVFVYMFRVSGEFPSIDCKIVASLEFCFDADLLQHFQNGLSELPEVNKLMVLA
ncbi:hypothetical protein DSECCO2_359230 [anaerobic digester metagenome]